MFPLIVKKINFEVCERKRFQSGHSDILNNHTEFHNHLIHNLFIKYLQAGGGGGRISTLTHFFEQFFCRQHLLPSGQTSSDGQPVTLAHIGVGVSIGHSPGRVP